MKKAIKGISASNGYAFGYAYRLIRHKTEISDELIENIDKELQKFYNAKEKAIKSLDQLYEKALLNTEDEAQIFEVHKMMIEDLDYNKNIINLIEKNKYNARYAISKTSEKFFDMFNSLENDYFKARSVDVLDISNKLLEEFENNRTNLNNFDKPVILIAEDLFPSETISLDHSKILGFAIEKGSKTSHTAILARTLDIPLVMNLDNKLSDVLDGDFLILDGFTGEIFINPTEKIIEKYHKKAEELMKNRESLTKLINIKTKIPVFANAGSILDVKLAKENGADGIGLFRSEFIYMNSKNFPTEEKQFEIYKEILTEMSGKKVIIRTLDLGADKQANYFNLPYEENPALGYRAIRICLNQQEIFKTQLKALYRASVYGKLAIMFPMIISIDEIIKIRGILKEIEEEFAKNNINFDKNIEIGIMIETPASAIISDEFAKYVDFFSIGTNDLTQYTLAVDRMNSKISNLYDHSHKAVLQLIKMTIKNAHTNNIWVGICGEASSDLNLTEIFLKMGIDELSVSPMQILKIKEKILSIEEEKTVKN